MKVAILHAYSATNSGDGLLVEEAISLTRSALGDPSITVFALDPSSFDIAGIQIMHPYTGAESTPTTSSMLRHSLTAWLRGARLPAATRSVVDSADLVVGVGGGYLRAGNLAEALKMLLAHAPQLPRVSHSKSVYLPQSIGPLRYGVASILGSRLCHVTEIGLRDNRSREELAQLGNTSRLPDTALLGIAGDLDANARATAGQTRLGLVARALPGSRRRQSEYRKLIGRLYSEGNAMPLVQATARGNDDAAFYSALGWAGTHETLRAATASTAATRPGVVASVRLHGAIQSIRNGVPAIHLSYERKGWGAYEDLGLPEYVHNAYAFDPGRVLDQAVALRTDPTEYWAAVDRALPALAEARQRLVDKLAATQSVSSK